MVLLLCFESGIYGAIEQLSFEVLVPGFSPPNFYLTPFYFAVLHFVPNHFCLLLFAFLAAPCVLCLASDTFESTNQYKRISNRDVAI
jgi:hypothetical protein